jgi:cell division protein FtsQ
VTQTLGTRPERDEQIPEVDPRIQARRDLVAHEHSTRRRRRLVVAAAVVLAAAVAWGVTHSPLLAVHRLVVKGTPHVPAAEIVSVSGIRDGEHLVDVDESRARARLLALPWVADAHVDVSWQGTAHLSVTERTPVAAVVSAPHRWLLVDAKGRALAGAAGIGSGRMVITGVAPVRLGQTYGAGLAAPLAITTALRPGLRSRVGSIGVGKDGSVTLQLRSGGVAQLCQPVDLAAKLASLTTVFAHVDDRNIRVVDVCIPDSPVITRTQGG